MLDKYKAAQISSGPFLWPDYFVSGAPVASERPDDDVIEPCLGRPDGAHTDAAIAEGLTGRLIVNEFCDVFAVDPMLPNQWRNGQDERLKRLELSFTSIDA